MKQTDKTTFDFYKVTDICAILAVLPFIAFCLTKANSKIFGVLAGVCGAGACIAFSVQLLRPAEIKKETSSPVIAKDEDSDQTEEITKPVVSKIDGFKIVTKTDNTQTETECKIIKLPDGVHATIDAQNEIKIKSLTGYFIYKIRGGEFQSWAGLFGKYSKRVSKPIDTSADVF